MPKRSFFYALPANIQHELRERLIDSGFGNYEGHSAWLKSIGYTVSKSALHKFGQRLEKEEKQTRAWVSAVAGIAAGRIPRRKRDRSTKTSGPVKA